MHRSQGAQRGMYRQYWAKVYMYTWSGGILSLGVCEWHYGLRKIISRYVCVCIYIYMYVWVYIYRLPSWLSSKESAAVQELQETQFPSLDQEEDMPTHFSILAGKILRTEEPGRPQYIGSHRVKHSWSYWACTHTHTHTHTYIYMLICQNPQPQP